MKIKGLNKIVADSKLLNGNAYLQICYNKKSNEVFAIWHAGYCVNFQSYFADKAIHTICNIQSKTTQKYIRYKMYRCLGFFRGEFETKDGICYWDDCDFSK